jgi:integrase
VVTDGDAPRDLSRLVVPLLGSLEATGDLFEPFRLIDVSGVVVAPAAAYFRELAACGRPAATHRSYGMDVLRWFRFLWATGVCWDQATAAEARDFCCWIGVADKPVRSHWRYPGGGAPGMKTAAGAANPVTGKRSPGRGYAAATVVHCESVLRGFYVFHLEAGTGPMVNPFPLARGRRAGRSNAHHNPMQPFPAERAGRYRPKLARRVPRQIPDVKFDELFALLGSHRDRALVAFWVSTGARASELLGATAADADPGQQLITVIRKGTRALQRLPASPDAFVWLRLYQAQMRGLVPPGRDQPLWWTLRRPFRALSYDAARLMFTRAGAAMGANWSLHDLRHSAAYRMASDPAMPLTDLQWVMGHAHLSTTEQYLNPLAEDVIEAVLAFHERQRQRGSGVGPAPEYRPKACRSCSARTCCDRGRPAAGGLRGARPGQGWRPAACRGNRRRPAGPVPAPPGCRVVASDLGYPAGSPRAAAGAAVPAG